MGTKRIDRTGRTYGAIYVIGADPESDRSWIVKWACCGRVDSIDSMQVSFYARVPSTRCRACVKAGRYPDEAPTRTLKSDLRDRTKSGIEAQEAARARQGITIPGRGFWPLLHGPMGPRFGHGYGPNE